MQKGNKNYGFAAFLIPFVVLAFALTIAVMLVLALLYMFIPFSESVLEIITMVSSIIIVFVVSCLAGKASGSVLTSGIVGLVYTVIRSIIAVALGVVPLLDIRTLFIIITGFLIGILGGILGSDGGRKKRRRYR